MTRPRRRGVHKPRRRSAQPTAEQLDYEMELLKAQREGREEEFRAEQAAKRREKKKKALDEEMDAYFASKHAPPATDAEAAKSTDKTPEKPREGKTDKEAATPSKEGKEKSKDAQTLSTK